MGRILVVFHPDFRFTWYFIDSSDLTLQRSKSDYNMSAGMGTSYQGFPLKFYFKVHQIPLTVILEGFLGDSYICNKYQILGDVMALLKANLGDI